MQLFRRTLAALAAFLLSTTFLPTLLLSEARATSVVPLDIDQMIASAQHVVHARCTGNEVQPDPIAGVVTVTTFDVLDRVKGPGGRRFVVRQPGGELNGMVVNFHVPTFTVGEEYVLFMPASSHAGLASPVGLSQGVFDVVASKKGSKEVRNGRDFAELIANTDAANVPTGILNRMQFAPQERKQIELKDFMSLVRTKAGNK